MAAKCTSHPALAAGAGKCAVKGRAGERTPPENGLRTEHRITTTFSLLNFVNTSVGDILVIRGKADTLGPTGMTVYDLPKWPGRKYS